MEHTVHPWAGLLCWVATPQKKDKTYKKDGKDIPSEPISLWVEDGGWWQWHLNTWMRAIIVEWHWDQQGGVQGCYHVWHRVQGDAWASQVHLLTQQRTCLESILKNQLACRKSARHKCAFTKHERSVIWCILSYVPDVTAYFGPTSSVAMTQLETGLASQV